MNELLSQAKENLSFLGITAAVIIALAVISKLTEKKFTHLRHVSPARRVSIIGICSAIAVVLHILDFPLPFLAPEFYKLDFSEVPVLLGGFFLYKKKGMDLAAIIGSAGIFSTFFGFMYGSFFGFENVLPARWLKPKEAMMTLPVVGQMNTVFVVAIVFGMFLILTAMILHIIVAVRNHDIEGTWFDTNGVAGFIFYGFVVASLILFMSGHALPATIIMVLVLGLPLLWPLRSR